MKQTLKRYLLAWRGQKINADESRIIFNHIIDEAQADEGKRI